MFTQTTAPTAADVSAHLRLLYLERALADLEHLTADAGYMADLAAEIAATRSAYVGAAVTELATLRGELSGRPQG